MTEINKLKLHGRNLEGLPYLFSPSSDEGIFSEIYLDMVRCNDLAFVILSSGETLRENEYIYLDTAKHQSNPESLNYLGSIFEGTLNTLPEANEKDYFDSYFVNQQKGFVDELYSYKEFEMLYSKSLVLGMIQFTFESSLKKLLSALDPEDPHPHHSSRIVESLIEKLDYKIGNQSVINDIIEEMKFSDYDFMKVYKPISKLRNNFVHGNWEQLKEDVSLINPRDFFFTISKLLMRYQEAFNRLNLLKRI